VYGGGNPGSTIGIDMNAAKGDWDRLTFAADLARETGVPLEDALRGVPKQAGSGSLIMGLNSDTPRNLTTTSSDVPAHTTLNPPPPAAAEPAEETYPQRSETPAVPWGERAALAAQQAATGQGIQSNRPIYRQGNTFTDDTRVLNEGGGDVTFLGGPRMQAEQAAQASNSDQQLANVLRGIASPETRAQVTADWYAREQASKHDIAKAEATGRAYALNTETAGQTPMARAEAENMRLANEEAKRRATIEQRAKQVERGTARALQLTGNVDTANTLGNVLAADDAMLGADSNKLDDEIVKAHIARNAVTQGWMNDEPGLYNPDELTYKGLNRGLGAWFGQFLPYDNPGYNQPYWTDAEGRKVSVESTPEMISVLEGLRARQAGR
jgi:hypothetical protein